MIPDWLAELVTGTDDLDALLPQRRVVELPMITRFRGITSRQAVVFRGPAGWSEFSPFLEYAAPEAARWLAGALEFGHRPAPEPLRDAVPLNGTIPDCSPDAVPGLIARYPGAGTFKIKIAAGGIANLDTDLARIRAVRAHAPAARLRFDANAGYPLAAAQQLCVAVAALPEAADWLEYIEQPVAAVEDLARLREWIADRGLPIRIAADESIRKAEDPYRVAALGAADVVIVKAQPLGGAQHAADVVTGCGLPAVVSSALETGIGLRAGALLAASLPVDAAAEAIFAGPPACGLGTGALFTTDIIAGDTHRDGDDHLGGGLLSAWRAEPDPELLAAHTADAETHAWWDARVRDCLSELRRQV
ncbi:o-succinylbenzoate synthase [Brevibacterium gallinarum]|uniref:o-succinylbenzoate synthase n=1 Tax=Brevibacterium gallinarum TaxID=2762220 RepID=A0ABR8WQ66_9MICO|nr:o-succinylbenzoate synthase [Brevibacterium gallinarum]MBD8019219.1 o-succinylbenzoate synthase [Brevibacterium gallinarum]